MELAIASRNSRPGRPCPGRAPARRGRAPPPPRIGQGAHRPWRTPAQLASQLPSLPPGQRPDPDGRSAPTLESQHRSQVATPAHPWATMPPEPALPRPRRAGETSGPNRVPGWESRHRVAAGSISSRPHWTGARSAASRALAPLVAPIRGSRYAGRFCAAAAGSLTWLMAAASATLQAGPGQPGPEALARSRSRPPPLYRVPAAAGAPWPRGARPRWPSLRCARSLPAHLPHR